MKKRIFLIVILSFFIHSLLFSELKPKFRLIIDLWSNPFLFEKSLDMYGFSLNGSIMGGVRLNKFTIGAEAFQNYFTMNAYNNINHLTGAWNIVRGTINGYFEPVDWVEFKLGLGGAWFSSSYIHNKIGITGKDEGGISVIFDTAFRPAKYIQLKIINRLDLFFAGNSVAPYYYGGIRCDFRPGLEWLNLYIETSGMTWFHKGLPVDINSGLFAWAVGVSIDMTFPDTVNNIRNKIKIIKEKNIIIESQIAELKKAKEGDIIKFSNIIFFPDSDEIKQESFAVLNAIAKVLIKRKNTYIEIRGHTNNIGNPQVQITLSKNRSKMVKSYLARKKVDGNMITTFGFGGFYSQEGHIAEENRCVELKILSKNDFINETVFDKLSNAKKGDIISFLNITFEKESNEIAKKSIPVLDKIAVILQERKAINIAIKGYTGQTKDTYADLESCLHRAKKIKSYLIKKEIKDNRIKILVSKSLHSKYSIKNRSRIEIKIL